MKNKIIATPIFIVIIATILLNTANAGLKIYYIRHAEGGHNVKKEWQAKGIPESEWPAYVGNQDMFTPKGKTEVVAATEKLKQYKFDFIATSPLWRTRNTIIPYLRETKQEGEVWPELREGPGMTTILSKDIPDVKKTILNKGKKIELPGEERDVLKRRSEARNHYAKYPRDSTDNEKVAYMKHVTLYAIKMVEKRFGDSDKSILLAGHNSSGVSLLKLLLGEQPKGDAQRGIINTGIWMVEKQKDGSYKLKIYNDKPYSEK